MDQPYLSVIIPVHNEAANLAALMARLYPVLQGLAKPFEIIFTDDGSGDGSLALLQAMAAAHPNVRVIEFSGNFGQHMAILAAFEIARGEVMVTLDADLQNPPEEIAKLLTELENGHDVVGGVREDRHDPLFRKMASLLVNKATRKMTGMQVRDFGCMLRAYRRPIVDAMNRCQESSTFIPALAQSFAANPAEVVVAHAPRAAGQSNYSLSRLIRLHFDLMTGFSVVPLHLLTGFGVLTVLISVAFGIILTVRSGVLSAEAPTTLVLFDVVSFLLGVVILGIGVVGEYVGRIYLEVRRRPRYIVRRIHGAGDDC